MSSSILSSSLLFTLFFILVSHVTLPASGAALYETVCNDAKEDKDRCLQVLSRDPQVHSAKDYVELSKFILKIALKNATVVQNILKQLAKTQNSPAIVECANFHYDGVVASCKSALGELYVDPQTASYDAGVAGDGPQNCETALAAEKINNPSITALNNEVLLLCTIAFLATNRIPLE